MNATVTHRHTPTKRRMRRRSPAVTLVELLIVLAIIGLLLAILIPAVQQSRAAARRSHCQSNMKQIGLGLDRFVDNRGQRGRYPNAAMLPSVTPERPSLTKVLEPFTEANQAIFACPDDELYFPVEGISYEYPAHELAGKTRAQIIRRPFGAMVGLTAVQVLADLDAFHGTEGEPAAQHYLFADGHIDTKPGDVLMIGPVHYISGQ